MIPNVPLWKIFIFSQVGNGIWLPIVIIFILLLVNRKDLMGEHTNTLLFNIVAWVTAVFMIILTFVLVGQAIYQYSALPPPTLSLAGDLCRSGSYCHPERSEGSQRSFASISEVPPSPLC